jgi:hypothetical protein
MLPVHSDLFLYVMRERNNRLFYREIRIKARLFFPSPVETKGGGGQPTWMRPGEEPGEHLGEIILKRPS